MAASAPSPVPGVPITVGVTGHRDLRPEDVPHLEAAVRRVFATLRADYPHTNLLVVSPLAEGADRLVARIAVEARIPLIVPMPLEVDDYRHDFSDEASVAEFNALLQAAERHFAAPTSGGVSLARPECYAHVGAYVARHCHILLALWDGETPQKVGGTAEVVRQRRHGLQSQSQDFVRLLDATDTGVVYHLVTPRRSNPKPHGVAYSLHVLPPGRHHSPHEAQSAIHRICESTDAFNAAVSSDPDGAARRTRSAAYLLPARAVPALPDGLDRLRSLYAAADGAALRYQRRTTLTLRTLFWLAFGFICAFEIFAHAERVAPEVVEQGLLVLYVALFAAGYFLHRWAAAREIDTRHLDYRALAEGLRIEFYWRVAEVPSAAADYCMRYRLEELDWIRLALRSCELWCPPFSWTETPTASADAVRAVVTAWVHGQRDYFARTVRREERHLRRLERWTRVLLSIAAAAVLVVFIPTFQHQLQWIHAFELPPLAHAMIIATIGLASAGAGLLHGYAEQRALSVHIKRYERMHFLFAAALRVLESPIAHEDWVRTREVLGETGRESLEENADWVMLHRERPIELPGA